MHCHISTAITDKCWNLYDSYGEICVHCGCCSPDNKIRAEARLEICKRRLEELLKFNDWVEGWEETQKKNIASDIRYYKRRIRYYKKRLQELN